MGQKVHPYGFRLGYTKPWKSRWFVEREAHILQIAGWVRNNPDGSVEVVARGTRDQLSGLRSRLEEGPRAARVDQVEESDAETMAGLTSFQVRG